jgi:tryptophan synthase beta chain
MPGGSISLKEATVRWNLTPDQVPTAWFNVAPHLPEPLAPPLHPATR